MAKIARRAGFDQASSLPPIDFYNPRIPKAPPLPHDLSSLPNAEPPVWSGRPEPMTRDRGSSAGQQSRSSGRTASATSGATPRGGSGAHGDSASHRKAYGQHSGASVISFFSRLSRRLALDRRRRRGVAVAMITTVTLGYIVSRLFM